MGRNAIVAVTGNTPLLSPSGLHLPSSKRGFAVVFAFVVVVVFRSFVFSSNLLPETRILKVLSPFCSKISSGNERRLLFRSEIEDVFCFLGFASSLSGKERRHLRLIGLDGANS